MNINQDKTQFHLHLWYEDESIYLIDKVSRVHDGRVNLSFNDDGKANDKLIDYCQSKFSEVKYIIVPNGGNDQIGFFQSFKKNKEDKPYIFYAHDKNPDKREWVDQCIDPLVNNVKAINEYLESAETGMISSANPKRLEMLLTEEKLIEIDKETAMCEKKGVVLARQTLIWLRELQYILYDVHGFIDKKQLNFQFTAGNMFIIDSDIVDIAHSVIHPTFFPTGYREDGDMPHALERFYYYVSLCMKRKNIFI